jgi:hypothetical protein
MTEPGEGSAGTCPQTQKWVVNPVEHLIQKTGRVHMEKGLWEGMMNPGRET